VPQVDFYSAGPPCQPYSKSGRKMGLDDSGNMEKGDANRGLVLLDVVGYIVSRRPKTFVIEEVEGLNQGEMEPLFRKILKMLKARFDLG
jgi:site-specific DNA-cytosine methylase